MTAADTLAKHQSDLPNGWKMADLEDVVDILDRKRVPVNAKEREKRLGTIPYYGATGQVGWIDDFLFDEELVLLGEDGAPFLDAAKPKAYLIRGKSWVNNHAHVLRALGGIPNSYIKHYLDIFDYHGFVTGTTRLKLNQTSMRRIPVPIAPKNEQKRIVAEIEKQFSRLDEAVDNLKRVKANLKRYKASLLKAAVEGKLTEEWRKSHSDVEPADILLERILAERRRKWEEADLAKMKAKGKEPKDDKWKKRYQQPATPRIEDMYPSPRSWTWATLEQINKVERPISYGVLQPGPHVQDGVPFIRVGDINDGKIVSDDIKRINPRIAAKYPRTCLKGREVLITLVGAIGRTAVVPESFAGANTARAVGVIPVTNHVNSHWVEIFLRNPSKIREMTDKAHEVARKTLNLEDVRMAIVALPPIEEQAIIVEEVDRRLAMANKLEIEINMNLGRAERVRQSVLKKAFSGKLVAQDPSDEPATVLLEKIRDQEKRLTPKRSLTKKEKVRRREKEMARMKKDILKFTDVMIKEGKPIAPEELFNKAGYTVVNIDDFYEALKHEVDGAKSIEEIRPDNTKVLLKLVS